MRSSEKTDQKQKSHLFQKGQSGNPKGKPKGSRHKATQAVMSLLDGEAEMITRKAINAALAGDMMAIRLIMDRLCPPMRERPIEVVLPRLSSSSDAPSSIAMILDHVADGNITPNEALTMTNIIANYCRVTEITDFESRIAKLEKENNEPKTTTS